MPREPKLPRGIRKKAGSYEVRKRVHGKDFSFTSKSLDACVEVLRDLENRADRPDIKTLSSYAYQTINKLEVAGFKSADDYRSLIKNFFEPYPIGGVDIRDITRPQLYTHYEGISGDHRWTKATVQKSRTALNKIIDAALNEGLLQSHPFYKVRLPPMPDAEDKWTWLETDEIKAVLSLQHFDHGTEVVGRLDAERRAVYAILIFAGLRGIEVKRLEWDHVFLTGPRPRIEVRKGAKTKNSIRDVPLLPPVIRYLDAWKHFGGIVRARGLVFPNDCGRPFQKTHKWAWNDRQNGRNKKGLRITPGTKTRAGIERHVRFHDLRHTCASHLVQGTWMEPMDLQEVRDWLGHSDISVTQRYAHLSPLGRDKKVKKARENWDEEQFG